MDRSISSIQNPAVKQILALKEKARERRKQGLFVIEGQREIELAIKADYQLETVYYSPDIIAEEDLYSIKDQSDTNTAFVEITYDVYEKIAYRATTEGIVAIAHTRDHSIDRLKITSENPLILVAEAPEKPGNIGALLRTADAANVDAVLIANPRTDIYNPNIVRSSVGCIFTRSIALGTTAEIITFLKQNTIRIYCAALQAAVPYHSCDFKPGSAIVVGTEADGLSKEWLKHSDQNIVIPMQGEIDSMNVSVAAGILIFEAKRQRNFN